jgi:hypothetical protein
MNAPRCCKRFSGKGGRKAFHPSDPRRRASTQTGQTSSANSGLPEKARNLASTASPKLFRHFGHGNSLGKKR